MNWKADGEMIDIQDLISQSLTEILSQNTSTSSLNAIAAQKERVEIGSARSGMQTLWLNTAQGPVHLHSAYDPASEAKIWADHVLESEWQIAVVLGLGLGYHIEELAKRYPERVILVVEPDAQVAQKTMQQRNLKEIFAGSKVTLSVSKDVSEVASALFQNIRRRVYQRKLKLLAWPPTLRLWRDFWTEVQRKLWESANHDFVNLNTYRSMSFLWLHNILENLPISVKDPGISTLFEKFTGKPAFLVAAGPSLDKNAHLLLQVKDRALIVAVLQAVRSLQRLGIKPDIVVSFDPKEANYLRHFQDIDTNGVLLLYADMLFPRILAEHQGPRMVMGLDIHPLPSWIHMRMGIDKGTLHSGPSVANLTWDLLYRLGCDPIIFVGQDLAFTNNKSHAEQVGGGSVLSPELLDKVNSKPEDYAFVEDMHGNQLLTNRPMLGMKTWFEERIATVGGNRRCINATEGGARIAGTQAMSLHAAIDLYCTEEFSPYQQLMDIHASELQRLNGLSLDTQLLELMSQIRNELTEVVRIGKLAAKVLRQLQKAIDEGTITEQKFTRLYKKVRGLDRSLSRLEAAHHIISVAIHHQLEAVNLVADSFLQEQDLLSRARLFADIYLPLFQASSEAAMQIQRYVDSSFTRLKHT
jgi:hypothetical protein